MLHCHLFTHPVSVALERATSRVLAGLLVVCMHCHLAAGLTLMMSCAVVSYTNINWKAGGLGGGLRRLLKLSRAVQHGAHSGISPGQQRAVPG